MCNMHDMDVREAFLLVAEHADGAKGRWAYEAFDTINDGYFEGRLPLPVIRWVITPHSACVACCRSSDTPVIGLHPSLLGGTEKTTPWGISSTLLGFPYAFDALLHECMHISVDRIIGRGKGTTSHNCDGWISEVNRIAPLLGLDIRAGMSVVRRTGRKVARGTHQDATVPFDAVAKFPHGVLLHLGRLDRYRADNPAVPRLSAG